MMTKSCAIAFLREFLEEEIECRSASFLPAGESGDNAYVERAIKAMEALEVLSVAVTG